MGQISLVSAVCATALLLGTALFVAPRLRRSERAQSGSRALTVLAIGLSAAAVLTLIALGTRSLA